MGMGEYNTPLLNVPYLLAALGVLSWVCGSVTLFGRPLALRMGPFWVGCRCFGVGVLMTLVSTQEFEQRSVVFLWVGALSLLVGSARTKIVAPVSSKPGDFRQG